MKIPDNVLRNSLIATYGVQGFVSDDIELPYEDGCPAVYRAKYVDRTLVELPSYAMDYGSMIHDALFAMEEEGLPLLPDALERAFARVSDPSTGERLVTLGPDAYREAIDDLTAYMERGGPNLSTIAVEQELTMPLVEIDGVQYMYGGRLDWVGIDPSEDEISTLYFSDYKTDRQPPSKEKVSKLPQLTGYGALLRANVNRYLPDVDPREIQIVAIYDAIKWYHLFSPRQHWEMDAWEDWARAMCRKIVADEEGLPILNDGCGGCQMKFDCPEFAKLPGEGETLGDRMSAATTLEQRVELMERAKVIKRSMDALVRDVQAELKLAAPADDEGLVFGAFRYLMTPDMETEWELPELQQLLGVSFYDVINVVAGRVEELCKRDPVLKNSIEQVKRKISKGQKLSTKKA